MVAVLVGLVATMASVGPALFIQSAFIGSAQRCEEEMRQEQAASNSVQTTCEEELGEAPFWFPVLIIAVGASSGTAGGFLYGFFSPPSSRRRGTQMGRYLPTAQSSEPVDRAT